MKIISLTFLAAILFTIALNAQNTTVQLTTQGDTSNSFRILNSLGSTRLQANSDGGFYLGGTFGLGLIPKSATGAQLMWYPRKAAFRVGSATTQWQDANIGNYSIGIGANTTASNDYSTAIGRETFATGATSIAIGYRDTASGQYAIALGGFTSAGGGTAIAMGSYTTASGANSTAMGYNTVAGGQYSTAIGHYSYATGLGSISIGYRDTASGGFSFALGSYASTNNMNGSFVIGDNSTTNITAADTENQMIMRFVGGYKLLTGSGVGVRIPHNGNSWASISDSAKKTNFVKSDGEYFLRSIAELNLGSWNYKSQDPNNYRHYGPMAQEVFRYFGKDSYGTIGEETTLASADMDGIMMICLQALEKRTSELQKANEKIAMIEKNNSEMQKRMERLENIIASMTKDNNNQITSSK
jgi:hypothetical protein